jgi:autotransporter-associated beta strand protein
LPVIVATNGSCAFSVTSTGFGMTYQWHRNGTNLSNGGNISGATSSQLVISPATTGDALSTANGYYVTVTGTGNYSTNSATNSLALIEATNLFYSGTGPWDLNTSPDWNTDDAQDQSLTFNFGDPVVFDDGGGGGSVTLNGSYLSAASVTVNEQSVSFPYTFTGSGSFAGPGRLIYIGSTQFTINNANTYSGGTVISNASALLYLGNYAGLGTGPVTLAQAGGKMELANAGSATSGINGGIVVADDFTIQVDASGTYAAVFFGDFSGTTGKTLTFNPKNLATTNRFRAYGINTLCNANLVLDNVDSPTSQAIYNGTVLAPYGASGSQTYDGVISGVGGIVQRGSGTTVLNGQNTYSGGTFITAGIIGFGTDTVGTVTSGPIGTGPLFVAPEVGSANGSGTVLAANGARTIANPIQYPSATNNQTLILSGTNALTFTGSFALNGQDGTTPAVNRTVQVSNTNTLTAISGVVSDGGLGFGFIKTGTGTLALNNTETYTGPTTNSAGTLQINGSLAAASAVTVSTNATLAGTGTINGTVAISAGGILAPGAASIGTLTVNNNLSIAGNLLFRVNKSLSPSQSNDTVVVSGTLSNTGTGTLTVTNLGSALVAGDRFVLFSKPLSGGASLIVTNASVAFTNNLAVDGSIMVLASAPSAPTGLKFTSAPVVSGTSLTISATNTGAGTAYLLTSTNVTAGLNTWTPVWTNVLGGSSSFTTNLSNIVNPALKNQFYILSSTNN